jgi:DNA polymerase-1
MIALIDADSIAYRLGYVHQDISIDQYSIVANAVDDYVERVLRAVNATHYHGFLGTNHEKVFRHDIDPEYKGNRNKAHPEWMDKWGLVVKNRLVYKWKFLVVRGIEAEDGVGIYAARYRKNSIEHCICAVDKDLLQMPGKHYNYEKETWTEITEEQAMKNLWKQVLTGDPTDNIKGIYGMGPKTASKVIAQAGSFIPSLPLDEMLRNEVLRVYIEKLGEHAGIYEFARNYGLVKLLDTQPDNFELETPHEFIENLI